MSDVERNHADGSPRRSAECAQRNPDEDDYHPNCCRFPKSCSPYPYDETPVTEDDLEPRRGVTLFLDPATTPHPSPCSDCGRAHLRGEHLSWTVPTADGDRREVWSGCVDCFIARTDPHGLNPRTGDEGNRDD